MVYEYTGSFPKEERYGLTSQIRRAAVSIPANISEGQSCKTTGEFKQFLGIAKGSLSELETLVLLSEQMSFLTDSKTQSVLKITTEISKMLSGLKKALEK